MSSPSLQSLRSHYATTLKRFIASSKSFEILNSTPQKQQQHQHPPPPQVLYVLDSSFNPPTLAHLLIASSPFLEKPTLPSRLLLLLATQNADKPSKPASFEDRLVMMDLFAHDLRSHLEATFVANTATSTPPSSPPQVDIGVTKKPYFVDKATAIDSAGVYPPGLPQTHLIGYDTLIRIFNTKYYPPHHTLKPLQPFLAQNHLRVTVRPDDEWGDIEHQRAFLEALSNGRLEKEGGQPEWAHRVRFVEGTKPGQEPVSSTRARTAAIASDTEKGQRDLETLVPRRVYEYLVSGHPYAASAEL